MNAEHLNSNPFQITSSDTEEANAEANLIDPSDDEDDFIDIDQDISICKLVINYITEKK